MVGGGLEPPTHRVQTTALPYAGLVLNRQLSYLNHNEYNFLHPIPSLHSFGWPACGSVGASFTSRAQTTRVWQLFVLLKKIIFKELLFYKDKKTFLNRQIFFFKVITKWSSNTSRFQRIKFYVCPTGLLPHCRFSGDYFKSYKELLFYKNRYSFLKYQIFLKNNLIAF